MLSLALIASTALTVLVLKSNPAEAHGGGLDASGCHTNHKTGDYHCHGDGKRLQGSYDPSPTVDFSCEGASFRDPTDNSYLYCPVSVGYGINKDGVKTGVAASGTTAFEAIKAVEPPSPPTSPPSPPVIPPTSSERPNIYGYVFRAVLGILAMTYFGAVILSKRFREEEGGWLVVWGVLSAWALACAIGVISIFGFLAPFLIIILLLSAVGGC